MTAPPAPATARTSTVRGILLYLGALMFFACVDGTTKLLTHDHPVLLVAAVRYSALMLIMATMIPRPRRIYLRTVRRGLTVLRSLSLALVTLLMGFALRRLPLAEATSIAFLAPIAVSVLSGPLLGEKLTTARKVAVVAGFLGVLLIARPGGSLDALGVFFALLAASCNVCYQLLSRVLNSEHPLHLLYHSAVVGAGVFLLALPFAPLHGEHLTWAAAGLMLLLGVISGLGHLLCMTLAYRSVPASLLAPMTYLQLIFAGLYGFLVFRQVPVPLSLLGMAVIAVSGVTAAVSREAAPQPA